MREGLPQNVLESERNGRIVATGTREGRRGGEDVEVISFGPEDPTAERTVGLSLTEDQFERKLKRGKLEPTTPDPSALNKRRSQEARAADSGKDAELTTDPDEWVENPDELDFPGVDTGPKFREEQEDFDTGGFLDNIL
jgi:hypothetical protein